MSYYNNYRKYMDKNKNENEQITNSTEQTEGNYQESATFSKNDDVNIGGTGGGGSVGGGGSGNDNGGAQQPPKKKRTATAVVVASVLAGGIVLGGAVGWGASQNRQTTLYKDVNSEQITSNVKEADKIAESSTITDSNKAFNMEEFTQKLDASGKTSKTASEIYKEVNGSIVSVETKYIIQQGNRSAETSGAGSGIIISDEGYILTNCHVVEGASSVSVTTADGEKHDVELVGIDSQTDLAVLKFDNSKKQYVAAPLGDSSSVEIGEMVVAIGNPLGELANSLSIGAISASERTIEMDNGSMSFLQTTAAISPGNSGGALINSYGEVIGVTTAKSTGSGVEGIGYAIPINNAKTVIEELINNGYVTGRPVLGINIQVIDDEIAQVYNMPEGLYITNVSENSAASKAGLKVGDIIVSFNGKETTTSEELNEAKNASKPGDTVEVGFYRKGQIQKASLTLGEQQPETQEQQTEAAQQEQQGQVLDPSAQDPNSNYYEYNFDGSGDSAALEEFFRSFLG